MRALYPPYEHAGNILLVSTVTVPQYAKAKKIEHVMFYPMTRHCQIISDMLHGRERKG